MEVFGLRIADGVGSEFAELGEGGLVDVDSSVAVFDHRSGHLDVVPQELDHLVVLAGHRFNAVVGRTAGVSEDAVTLGKDVLELLASIF